MVHQRGANKTRWRCAQINKTKCRAVLFTSGDQVRVFNQHNHLPTVEGKIIKSLCSQLVTIKTFDKQPYKHN